MATQVFISWSGELSRKLAEVVREWLPATLQFVKPYFTPVDVEKGTRWASEISGELSKSHVGIICLTRDNLSSPWILFEAGALSKNLDRSRVCTLLFGLEPAEVTGPLAVFQATRFTREDFKGLVEAINNAGADSKLDKPVLENVFEMWWSRLKDRTDKILAEYQPAAQDAGRPVTEMVKEILDLTRVHVRREQSRETLREKYLRTLGELLASKVIPQGTPSESALRTWMENQIAEEHKSAHDLSGGASSLSFSGPPEMSPPLNSPKEG